jgi:hypothetical protein
MKDVPAVQWCCRRLRPASTIRGAGNLARSRLLGGRRLKAGCSQDWLPHIGLLIFSQLLCLAAYAQAPSADLYVAPNGNDAWSGTLPATNAAQSDGPLASVARAQAMVRELRKAKPDQSRTVMLRAGTYDLPSTLSFTSLDSGAANYPTSWKNYPGESPVISGGVPAPKTWKHVDGSLWQVALPADTQPFEALFYNGQRRLRARTGWLRIAAEVPAKGENAGCPAIARSGHPSQAKCLDRFVYDPRDPIANWANLHASDTACPTAPNPYPVGDIEVILFNSATVDVLRVSCVDTARHMIYFVANARGDSDHYDAYGPAAGRRYIVENARDAFDASRSAGQTGLWFLDRSTSPWTLNYLARRGENPNSDSVVIPQMQPVSPMGGSLLSAVYLDYVDFTGITFEIDNFVPPATGFNNDEISGDTLPEAIDCISCKHIVFDNVTVRHTSASGIRFTSGSGDIDRVPTDLKIANSIFYDIGESAIRIGSHPRVGDRWNHVVQYVTVENNLVQGYSRVFAGGAGIAMSNGHDLTILHNDISDGYASGISICQNGCGAHDGDGYNILLQYNRIWNLVRGAGIYFSTGDQTGTGVNNKILNNSVDAGDAGICLDDHSAEIDVENNAVSRVEDAQEPARGAHPNTLRNNGPDVSISGVGLVRQLTPPPKVPATWPASSGNF